MKLLKNIKKNYYNNLFDSLLKEENYKQLVSDLKILSQKDKKLFFNIAPKYILETYHNYSEEGLLNKNLIWLNSFHKQDLSVLQNFLEFYLPSTFDKEFEFIDFSKELISFFQEAETPEGILSFDKILDLNEVVQFLISQRCNKYKFILNNSAFFEITDLKKYFTYTNLSCAYVYLIRNPINIFVDLSRKDISKDEAVNAVLHLDGRNPFVKMGKYLIEENTQSWETNVNSWTNENVLNTFNGLLIKYENLYEEGIQIFAEFIAHLNMSGLNIKLDYEKIQEFISNQKDCPPFMPSPPVEISNNTKKLFYRQSEDTAKKFQYEF